MRLPLNDYDLSKLMEPSLSKQQREERKSGMELTSIKDLLLEPDEEINWIVEGLLSKNGISLISAKPKTGKSTLARQLTLAIARGEPFLGRKTSQGLAVYLALEERKADVKKHFQLMRATGEESLKIFAGMAPADALEQIRKLAEEENPLLIIVDTLARLTRIKDLNDYSQVTNGLQPLLALAREVGSHVCLLHHAKKGDIKGIDSALGSTAITGTVDTIISLNRSDKYRTISTIQRIGDEIPETVLDFDSETRITTLGTSKEQTEIYTISESILDFITNQEEPISEKIIDESIEGNRGYRKKALRQLVADRKVQRTGDGKKNSPYLYFTNTGLLVSHVEGEPQNQNSNPDLTLQKPTKNSGLIDFDYEHEERFAIQNEGEEE